MPLGDKTGPNGQGAMTGRRLGYCTGNEHAGYTADTPGRGMGRGIGAGAGRGLGRKSGKGRGMANRRGRGFSFAAEEIRPPMSAADEASMLESEAKRLEQELEAVKKRRDELDT